MANDDATQRRKRVWRTEAAEYAVIDEAPKPRHSAKRVGRAVPEA
jgi:hypothetical protein